MDNITHIVMGAAIGEAVAGQKLGKKSMLWGAIAANIPDVDVFFAAFQSVPDSLLSHRGFTHSILFCVFTTLLLSWFMSRWKHSGSSSFKLWALIFSAGLFSHILIDACTGYGTGWYEPFSHYRVSFNNIFVVDPFYTLPLLVSFVALLILRKGAKARKWCNAFGIIVSTAYLAFTFANKIITDSVVEANLKTATWRLENSNLKLEHPASGFHLPSSYITTPTPLNNFLWYIIVRDTGGFYIGYHSIFDSNDLIDFNYFPQNKNLLAQYRGDEGVEKLIRFSQGYYCVTSKDSHIDFHDLRFGQIGGWSDPDAPFTFSYHLEQNANNELVIQRGRINIANKDALNSLIERIKGK